MKSAAAAMAIALSGYPACFDANMDKKK